jgi:hypothetical protein
MRREFTNFKTWLAPKLWYGLFSESRQQQLSGVAKSKAMLKIKADEDNYLLGFLFKKLDRNT